MSLAASAGGHVLPEDGYGELAISRGKRGNPKTMGVRDPSFNVHLVIAREIICLALVL
jgi:hypothetical protein